MGMRREIRGCRVIVTGASSGIGRALVLELVRQGAQVVAVARREELLEKLVEEVIDRLGDSAERPPIEIVCGDVTDAETRIAAVEQAEEAFGGLDALVNNAGVSAVQRFVDSDEEVLRQVMEVNFFAATEMIREAVPLLEQGNWPIVVNVSSILAHRALPQMSAYCASKFALQGLSESLRVEFRSLKIDVLTVCPGATETDIYQTALEGEGESPWPGGQGATAEKVARAAVKAMRQGKREIIPSLGGRLLVWANKRIPGFLDSALKKYG